MGSQHHVGSPGIQMGSSELVQSEERPEKFVNHCRNVTMDELTVDLNTDFVIL